MTPDNITILYRTQPAQWRDPWDRYHPVSQVIEVVNVAEHGTWEWPDPYQPRHTVTAAVMVDDWARTYRAHPPIDYFGQTAFVRDGDKAHFYRRLPSRCIDLNGKPITEKL